MKKLLLVALAAVGLASCVQTEELSVANNNEAIAFDTFVDNATKGQLYTTANLDHFKVYGTISQNDAVVTNIFPGVDVTKPNDVWTYDSQYTQYWIPGFTYDFTGVVDGEVAVDGNGMPETISTDMTAQNDVLYATVHREFKTGDQASKVGFNFAHLLSKAKFTVKNTIANGQNFVYNIESVKITNAYETAEYNVANEKWTGAGDYDADFEVNTAVAQGTNTVSKDILLVPGTKELAIAIEYNLTYKNANGNEATLVDDTKNLTAVLTLEKGKAYNFVVEFGNPGEEIEFEVKEVVDWNTDFPGSVSHYVSTAAELETKANAATEDITIALGADITGDVMLVEKPGVHVTIDGNGHKYDGQIKIHNNSEYNSGAVTIKNVNFVTANDNVNFIYAVDFETGKRYSQNITVENCTFEAVASRATNTTVVGVQVKASKNLVVKNCTAKNIHSLLQAQSCDTDVIVKGCKVEGCKNGVAFKQVKKAVVEGTTITAEAYGIRFDGNTDNYGIVVKNNNNITANQPLIVRKMTGANNTITLEGTNTLTTNANPAYQIVITKGSDDEPYVEPTGTYTLTGADDYMVYPAVEDYDAFLEKISDDTWYDATKTELAIEDVADFAAFIETANSGNDFEGKTLKLTGDIDLYFKDVTALADGDPVTFRPIGDTKYNGGKPFKGTFDGQGHTIKNLYQNGWDLGYNGDNYGSYGLFGNLQDATVKNVVIEGSESYIEGGDVSFIAGSATGNCVFENIEIKSGTIATFDNGNGGIIGWSGAGNYTFKNITIGEDVVIAGMWGSFDQSCGGIVGQAESGATYNFENVTINCRLDVYNDVTASWQYYLYRMCGMIIGRCKETTTINGVNYPDLSKYNMTFNNVVVNYGDWMNYHYCHGPYGMKGNAGRVEPGYAYGGLDINAADHNKTCTEHMQCIPFDQLIGGDQIGVRGLREVAGVTVNYPASYRREVSSAAALTEALGKGVSVILDEDIDFGSTQLAITGENQVVDLGGHALTTANNWGGISLKNGASIKNGTITHSGNTAAIKAFNGSSVENVTINATCATADKTVTGIAVQQGANIESIKNVTINGVSQGIEVGYQATVGLIEKAVVNESNNGTAKGIALVINGGKVGKAKDCTFKGETYGVTMHLKGVFAVGLELENCQVEGTTASIYAWDEKGISNTSGSLNLTYDAATTLTGPFVWDFEDECQSVVTLNRPQ